MYGLFSQIIYKNPVFQNSQVKYFQHKVRDDEDVQSMFESHEHYGFDYIELYILLSQPQQSQIFGESQLLDQSQIFDQSQSQILEQDKVDVVDEEEEESETQVDYMVNLFGTGEYTTESPSEHVDQETLRLSYVYCPLQRMTNLHLDGDDSSLELFYNPSQHIKGVLKVGNQYRTKAKCMQVIIKFRITLLILIQTTQRQNGM